jgi:hypothetical protein
MPGVEHVEPHLRLAMLAQIGAVHMDAKGAAVDLRDAQLDQFHQHRIEPAGVESGLQRVHRLDGFGREGVGGGDTLGHLSSPGVRDASSLMRRDKGGECDMPHRRNRQRAG